MGGGDPFAACDFLEFGEQEAVLPAVQEYDGFSRNTLLSS
jgi:hypothetical protein